MITYIGSIAVMIMMITITLIWIPVIVMILINITIISIIILTINVNYILNKRKITFENEIAAIKVSTRVVLKTGSVLWRVKIFTLRTYSLNI